MRKLLFLIVFCGIYVSGPAALYAKHYMVFLFGGQSNMDGRASLTGLPISPVNLQQPQTDVLFFHDHTGADVPANEWTSLAPGSGVSPAGSTNCFGPEVLFGRTIADSLPNDNIAIIKHAQGGTKLATDWFPYPPGQEFIEFNATVTTALAALSAAGNTYEVAGLLWMQGESDSTSDYANAYQANLTNLIAQVRSRYGSEIRCVIGETWRNEGDASHPGTLGNIVSQAQQDAAAADQLIGFVSTRDFTWQDEYHLDPAGQMALGTAFANVMTGILPEDAIKLPSVAAHWSFDIDYSDVSGNGAYGTLVTSSTSSASGITNVQGQYCFGGGALSLDTGYDYVSVLTKSLVSDFDGYAIAFWAKNAQAVSSKDGMVFGDVTDTANFVWLDQKFGGFRMRTNSSTYTADFAVGEDTLWHHYVIVVSDLDSDGVCDDVSLYFDGALFGSLNDIAGTDLDINAIGCAYNSSTYDYDFYGQIDELWLFNKAINATSVEYLYSINNPALDLVEAGDSYITWLDVLPHTISGSVNVNFAATLSSASDISWQVIDYDCDTVPQFSIIDNTTEINAPNASFSTDTAGSYTIELTVTNSADQSFSDTMTIKVADNSCGAASLMPDFSYDYFDTNRNCIIDLNDLSSLVENWLNDTSLKIPYKF